MLRSGLPYPCSDVDPKPTALEYGQAGRKISTFHAKAGAGSSAPRSGNVLQDAAYAVLHSTLKGEGAEGAPPLERAGLFPAETRFPGFITKRHGTALSGSARAHRTVSRRATLGTIDA